MPYKEKKIEKVYYTIGEVAKKIGVKTSTITHWEKEFDMLKPKINNKGNRQYNQKNIEIIEHILHLTKEKGYTLKGANDYMIHHKNLDKDMMKNQIIKSLKNLKSFLTNFKNRLA